MYYSLEELQLFADIYEAKREVIMSTNVDCNIGTLGLHYLDVMDKLELIVEAFEVKLEKDAI